MMRKFGKEFVNKYSYRHKYFLCKMFQNLMKAKDLLESWKAFIHYVCGLIAFSMK